MFSIFMSMLHEITPVTFRGCISLFSSIQLMLWNFVYMLFLVTVDYENVSCNLYFFVLNY